MTSRKKGFTLIELLVVVAIIGILVAISAINYLSGIQRARQKRSMADMRMIAMAVDAYSIDYSFFPPSAALGLPEGLTLPTKTIDATGTAAYVAPTYIESCPLTDGWHSWFQYNDSRLDFVIRSCGSDGVPDASPQFGPSTRFSDDIIFVDSQFIQWPEGVQE